MDCRHGVIGQNGFVDRLRDQAQLVLSERRFAYSRVSEVKAQAVGSHQGAGLLDVLAQGAAQRVVQEVGGGVIAGDVQPPFGVHQGAGPVAHPGLA